MQIGCCWFDAEKHQLLNQDSSLSWQMPEHESAVLTQLVVHRGQVVSNQTLVQVLHASGVLDAKLYDIIQKIRRFLGQKDALLLEKVADQGYILHDRATGPSMSLWRQPKRMIPLWRYLLLAGLTLGIIAFMYTRVGHADFFEPHHQETFITTQGKVITLHWYDDPKRRLVLRSSVNHIKTALQTCNQLAWSSIYLSISQDGKMVNLLSKRGKGLEEQTKSIKLIVEPGKANFVDKPWLTQVGICNE